MTEPQATEQRERREEENARRNEIVAAEDQPKIKDLLQKPETVKVMSQLAPKHMTPERLVRLSIAAVTRTPDLAKCHPMTLLGSFLECAMLGLEPNSPLQHVHLLPFWNSKMNNERGGYEITRIIGYRGFVELGFRTGRQIWPHADVVYPTDYFDFSHGSEPFLKHKVAPRRDEGAEPDYAYCHVRLSDGQAFVVMPYEDVLKRRAVSHSYRTQPKYSPWSVWPDQMARKTAIRHLYGGGEVQMSPEVHMAISVDDQPMDYQAIARANAEQIKEALDTFVAGRGGHADEDERPQRSALSVIAARNAPPPQADGGLTPGRVEEIGRKMDYAASQREPIPQTSPGRGMPLGTNQRAPQAQAAPEAVSSSSLEQPPPTESGPAGPQAGIFKTELAHIGGEFYRNPEDAALALQLLIEQSAEPGKILDEYASVMEALPRNLANEVLAVVAAWNNKRERKQADAERERQASAKTTQEPKRRGRPPGSKNRPPEPAGEARSQEPAATPAPGREDSGFPVMEVTHNLPDEPPDWLSDGLSPSTNPDVPEPSLSSDALYVLVDTRGDLVSRSGLSAIDFMAKLIEILYFPGTPEGERRAWKARNRAEIQRIADTEGGDLANDALDLLS